MEEKKIFSEVKDSGKRQEFNTGSVRDTADGKGMPHLIPGEAYSEYKKYSGQIAFSENANLLEIIENDLDLYSCVVDNREDNQVRLYDAIAAIINYLYKEEGNTYAGAMRRLGNHFANGAKKYSKNNWRKGQPCSRYYDSTKRHLWALIDKKQDEDHAAAIFWNLLAIVQTKLDVLHGNLSPELNDFPFTKEEVWGKK